LTGNVALQPGRTRRAHPNVDHVHRHKRAMNNTSVTRHPVLVDAVAAGDPDRARPAVEARLRGAATNLMIEFTTNSRGFA